MSFAVATASFFRRCGVGLTPDGGHDGIGEHDKGDVPVPAMPGAAFVMVEAEFVLGGLEAFLDTPACALDPDQHLDGSSSGAPGSEVGEFAICEAAPDQHAAGPQAWNRGVEFGSIEICLLYTSPSPRDRQKS